MLFYYGMVVKEQENRSKKILGKQEDIAGTVAFPACAEASFIAGQTLSVSGGLTMG